MKQASIIFALLLVGCTPATNQIKSGWWVVDDIEAGPSPVIQKLMPREEATGGLPYPLPPADAPPVVFTPVVPPVEQPAVILPEASVTGMEVREDVRVYSRPRLFGRWFRRR